MNLRCAHHAHGRARYLARAAFLVPLLCVRLGSIGPARSEAAGAVSARSEASRPCTEVLKAALDDSSLASRMIILTRPGDTLSLSLAELASSAQCVEGVGGFSTTTGQEIKGTWAGVNLPDLLTRWVALEDDHSVVFEAEDGYRMSFTGREILDGSRGTWILAIVHDGAPIPPSMGLIRAIKVGPSNPMITGHLSVQRLSRINVSGIPVQPYVLAMRGKMEVDVDRQTLQSCASCHASRVRATSPSDSAEYGGVPLFRMLAFSDDSLYAPHRQDGATPSYLRELALRGYRVDVADSRGTTVSLDSRRLDGRESIILAVYRDGEDLTDGSAPTLIAMPTEGSPRDGSPLILPGVRTVRLHLP